MAKADELVKRIEGFKAKIATPEISAANRTILMRLLAKAEDDLAKELIENPPKLAPVTEELVIEEIISAPGIEYNAQQLRAIKYGVSGQSFVLTGPAGSGKTTTLKGVIQALAESDQLPQLQGESHKYLPARGGPGIVVCAFTNKAVENVKKHLSAELRQHCLTIHKLLEFEPVTDAVTDPITGKEKKTFRFEPSRDQYKPLPESIKVIIIDESSMVGVELWNMLWAAIQHKVQVIFVGDIQQLPPVFGKSIFIHAMQRGLPTVELTEVYRQALLSPILKLAHRILSGKMITAKEIGDGEWNIDAGEHGKTTFRTWKKPMIREAATVQMQRVLRACIDEGSFDPEFDVVLSCFNENFGVKDFNRAIAEHYAMKLEAEVWEVFAATNKAYFRLGERVLCQKVEHRVVGIKKNPAYVGKRTRDPSKTLNYEGYESNPNAASMDDNLENADFDSFDFVDQLMEQMSSTSDDDSPARRAASHIITVKSVETGVERDLRAAGEINELLLGYAITVHKSQGSEYGRVFFITHKCQQAMMYRELLYTAVTRAKRELVVMCEPSTFVVGINTQRIPGKTIEEKITAFDRYLKLEGTPNDSQVPKGLNDLLKKARNDDRFTEAA